MSALCLAAGLRCQGRCETVSSRVPFRHRDLQPRAIHVAPDRGAQGRRRAGHTGQHTSVASWHLIGEWSSAYGCLRIIARFRLTRFSLDPFFSVFLVQADSFFSVFLVFLRTDTRSMIELVCQSSSGVCGSESHSPDGSCSGNLGESPDHRFGSDHCTLDRRN